MLETGAIWGITGTAVTFFMFIYAMYSQYVPPHLRVHVEKYAYKVIGWISSYVHIKFNEYTEEGLKRSENYEAIRNYLSANSAARAKRLKANESRNSQSLVLSMDDHEEVEDVFEGVKVTWHSNVKVTQTQSDYGRNSSDERRFFTLTFHKRHRGMITKTYVNHVLKEGKGIGLTNRERKLYTNNSSQEWYPWRSGKWSNVPFHHPATFETLAMDQEKKEKIKKDLIKFSKSKDYYKKIGKAWKRGYLLFGPPGTGKSTMIAAMANFLEYDVYDLELTTVKDNTQLRRLLIETSAKSIIVIEDIDCSLNLTGQRKKKEEEEEDGDEKSAMEKKMMMMKSEGESKESKVTLSGLLNFIDGLWSACGGERIIVFTTNFVDKLDPALIRKGRMDKHIEMSYCGFEAFKVLAKNYLDVEESELFGEIYRLLEVEEIKMTPADVGENLLPKSEGEGGEKCLLRLIEALKEEKEEAKRKVEEEEKQKKEEEEEKKRRKEKKAEKEAEKSKTKKIEENGEEEH
ncbi:unnamed protein product [Cochlearia groenlandica]